MFHIAGFSKKGSSHERNEDSFMVRQNDDLGVALGVVSDGCSSIDHGDFASRLMVMKLIEGFDAGCDEHEVFRNMFHMNPPIRSRLSSLSSFQWGSATAGIINMENGRVNCSLYGDGLILYKERDFEPRIIHVSYKDNTPWYPVYANMSGLPGSWERTVTQLSSDGTFRDLKQTHRNNSEDADITFSFNYTSQLESITVLTDGIDSGGPEFLSPEWKAMVEELLEPRRGTGDWGTRMLNRFYRKYGPFTDDLTGVAWRNEVEA
jgi:hypothetical protein